MNKEIKQLINITNNIKGWLSIQEGIFLYKLARNLNDNAKIVEIGSWHGKSTVWLASALRKKKNAKIYAVDPHVGSPEKANEFRKINTYKNFKGNIKSSGIAEKVVPLRKTSLRAAKDFSDKVDLVFIDGSHKFNAARADFLYWKIHLKRGGWIVLHDATHLPGPWKVAKNYLLRSDKFCKTGMLGSMIFGQYCLNLKLSHVITNRLKNLFSYLFIISYVKMRKIPLASFLKKKVSKAYFKTVIKGL
jgi:predicted O-methyltransferase YrrM